MIDKATTKYSGNSRKRRWELTKVKTGETATWNSMVGPVSKEHVLSNPYVRDWAGEHRVEAK